MATTKKAAAEQAAVEEKKIEEKITQVFSNISNKDRRDAVKYFEIPFADFEEGDLTVVYAWLAEGKTKELEHYDVMPLTELEKILEESME